MRISSQNADMVNRSAITSTTAPKVSASEAVQVEKPKTKSVEVQLSQPTEITKAQGESKEAITKEQLQKAVEVMNDLIDVQHKSSKFVFHEGLNKYYVRLVDSKTEEVIKEIPPERLLDAFYEMQKLTGMIVDEKI